LQAICDADESLAQRFGSFYDAQKIYLDYDEMLPDDAVDAVIIAVSDAFHVPAAMKALSAEPLGTNVYEVEELARRPPNVPSTACWAWSFSF
jgi:predicted dehydrogenase